MTLNANLLKVREYLAAGLPVVSTKTPEVEVLRLARIAETKEDFARAIEQALEDPGPRAERSDPMKKEELGRWPRRSRCSRHVAALGAPLRERDGR